jgi:hypothetical protein
MIYEPLNDYECLDAITEAAARHADSEAVRDLAERFESTEDLTKFIRGLPQRNDTGDEKDGPRIACGDTTQRLRLPAEDPNCVERSALYLAAAELIDPDPARQLATIATPLGRHTFPVEEHVPVRLDSRLTRNALDAGLYKIRNASGELGDEMTAAEAFEWVADIAEEPAVDYRNGPARVESAQVAFDQILAGEKLCRNRLGDVAFTLAVAEQAARLFGGAGVNAVKVVLLALGALTPQRNLSLHVGGRRIRPDYGLFGAIGRITGRLGGRVATAVLRAKLAQLGVTPQILGELESEFQREGRTLGPLATPAPMPGTLAALTTEALLGQHIAKTI